MFNPQSEHASEQQLKLSDDSSEVTNNENNNVELTKNEYDQYIDYVLELVNYLATFEKKYIGSRYLIELIANANRPIHSTNLRNVFNYPDVTHLTDEDADEIDYNNKANLFFYSVDPQWELPIEVADKQAITEVNRRLVKINEVLAHAKQCNNLAEIEDLIDERDKLIEWLQKALNRFNRPRYIQNQANKDYYAVAKSIKLIINKIAESIPDYAEFIKQHYQSGMRFCWRTDNLKSRK